MQELALLENTGTQREPLDDGERQKLRAALWALLAKRVRYDTMGDSSSVPVERAEALLESVCYTLRVYLEDNGLDSRALALDTLDAIYDSALACIERRLERARAMQQLVAQYAPPVASRSWRDTVRGTEAFFHRYDYRVLAQDVPCDIDYQLCLPASPALVGERYVSEYLRRWLCEIAVMRRLDATLMARLLHRFSPDPEGLLINLYEPVMVNAVGAALAGCSVRALDVPPEARERVAATFGGLGMDALRGCISEAARTALDQIGASDETARRYFTASALSLAPRVRAALGGDGLKHVFVSLWD